MHWTRRWLGLVASLASFSADAATTDDIPDEGERGHAPPLRLETGGFAASGPRFYVWEEDAREGREWAAELSRAAAAPAPGAEVSGPGDLDRATP